MPTLFGRRYMRPELKSSGEIYVGIFVLILAGSLCAALVVHSQGEAPKLFEITPAWGIIQNPLLRGRLLGVRC